MESFTLILPDEKAIETIISNLHAIGATDIVEETGKTFVHDPSGNRIELAV